MLSVECIPRVPILGCFWISNLNLLMKRRTKRQKEKANMKLKLSEVQEINHPIFSYDA
jgi:hypothetical protein